MNNAVTSKPRARARSHNTDDLLLSLMVAQSAIHMDPDRERAEDCFGLLDAAIDILFDYRSGAGGVGKCHERQARFEVDLAKARVLLNKLNVVVYGRPWLYLVT